jgi:thiol:disulfide interchange protein DsbC
MLVRILAFAAFCLAVLPAHADEAQIRRVIESKLGGAQIESVRPVPVLGLYEVVIRSEDGPRIVYTDSQATGIVLGSIYDVRHDRNLTQERMNKLLAIKFDSLPMQDAVKIRRGSGRRVLAMFSDPYCPACQQFEKQLAQVDDITIYVFMYPVIHPELAEQSEQIWCSPDRSRAWLDLALRGKRPTAGADCANPLARNLVLGHRLGVNSTPTLFLANGDRLRGGLSAAHLAAALDDVYRETKASQAPTK